MGVEILLLLIVVLLSLLVFGKAFANLVSGAVALIGFLITSMINLAAVGRRAIKK